MPKVITGTGLEKAYEVAENPVWNVAYYRKRHVTRRSAKVKALNVCLKARKILGEPLPAQIAKQDELWNKPPVGANRKIALSKAMRQVLSECKANPDKYCRAAASTMGLTFEECRSLLASINVQAVA